MTVIGKYDHQGGCHVGGVKKCGGVWQRSLCYLTVSKGKCELGQRILPVLLVWVGGEV